MATNQPQQLPSRNGLVSLIRRHQTTSFFIIAYATTWLMWTPIVLLGLPVFSASRHAPSLYVMPGIAIGVTGTAFLLTALTQGRAGVRRLLERLTLWRVGPQWWAVAVLLIPLIALLLALVLGSSDALNALAPSALFFYPAAYFVHFFFGPLFEETGWRGFALSRMQHRFGPLRGTLLLGLLWSAWHFFLYVPVWFASGDASVGLMSLVTFAVLTTSMTFVFTWLFNNTRASLLLSILLHGSVDGSITYIQVLGDRNIISADSVGNITGMGMLLACILIAVVLLITTRGNLGYGCYQRDAETLDLSPSASQPALVTR